MYDIYALLPLRIAAGVLFILHGRQKFKDFKGTIGFVQNEGFKPARFWAVLLTATELLGGVAFTLGLFTKVVALLLGVIMVVALYKHVFVWKHGFMKGYELALVLLAVCIAFFLLGGGTYSLDNLFF